MDTGKSPASATRGYGGRRSHPLPVGSTVGLTITSIHMMRWGHPDPRHSHDSAPCWCGLGPKVQVPVSANHYPRRTCASLTDWPRVSSMARYVRPTGMTMRSSCGQRSISRIQSRAPMPSRGSHQSTSRLSSIASLQSRASISTQETASWISIRNWAQPAWEIIRLKGPSPSFSSLNSRTCPSLLSLGGLSHPEGRPALSKY